MNRASTLSALAAALLAGLCVTAAGAPPVGTNSATSVPANAPLAWSAANATAPINAPAAPIAASPRLQPAASARASGAAAKTASGRQSSTDEMSMLLLQSVVTRRGEALDQTTRVMGGMNAGLDAITSNIGQGGGGTSGRGPGSSVATGRSRSTTAPAMLPTPASAHAGDPGWQTSQLLNVSGKQDRSTPAMQTEIKASERSRGVSTPTAVEAGTGVRPCATGCKPATRANGVR